MTFSGRTSTGMASMMDEMAKTLARRRANAEKKPEVSTSLSINHYAISNRTNYRFSRNQTMMHRVHGRNPTHYHTSRATVDKLVIMALTMAQNHHDHQESASAALARKPS